ncbi:hypothetical protein LAZ67_21002037 [Cordylochernes scorpioides]|uniref:Uncharacterized protein n=1 Tax=Cordylochernes scorpioides TaxID=51811 RepID=A0ABY6LMJ7_9ARAC|nr:hypothetical protein LAZ67_21002037 [Cordylochernes scorpioides]
MNGIEEAAWSGFKAVVHGYLGNRRDDNHKEPVQNMLKSYEALGVNMRSKVHYLHSHLDKFPDNLGERFHQDMKVMEKKYQGVWDYHMIAEYYWYLFCDLLEYTYKRKLKWLKLIFPQQFSEKKKDNFRYLGMTLDEHPTFQKDIEISYEALGLNMSIKVHYLHSHLDKFPDNLGEYSDEQGERIHQYMKVMEERYQGVWDCHMWQITAAICPATCRNTFIRENQKG